LDVEETPYEHLRQHGPVYAHGHHYEVKEEVGGRDHQYLKPIHFIIEEPMHEESHKTFHGREMGYMYPEQSDPRYHPSEHFDSYGGPAYEGLRHGETFGPHHEADKFDLRRAEGQEFREMHA